MRQVPECEGKGRQRQTIETTVNAVRKGEEMATTLGSKLR